MEDLTGVELELFIEEESMCKFEGSQLHKSCLIAKSFLGKFLSTRCVLIVHCDDSPDERNWKPLLCMHCLLNA